MSKVQEYYENNIAPRISRIIGELEDVIALQDRSGNGNHAEIKGTVERVSNNTQKTHIHYSRMLNDANTFINGVCNRFASQMPTEDFYDMRKWLGDYRNLLMGDLEKEPVPELIQDVIAEEIIRKVANGNIQPSVIQVAQEWMRKKGKAEEVAERDRLCQQLRDLANSEKMSVESLLESMDQFLKDYRVESHKGGVGMAKKEAALKEEAQKEKGKKALIDRFLAGDSVAILVPEYEGSTSVNSVIRERMVELGDTNEVFQKRIDAFEAEFGLLPMEEPDTNTELG